METDTVCNERKYIDPRLYNDYRSIWLKEKYLEVSIKSFQALLFHTVLVFNEILNDNYNSGLVYISIKIPT